MAGLVSREPKESTGENSTIVYRWKTNRKMPFHPDVSSGIFPFPHLSRDVFPFYIRSDRLKMFIVVESIVQMKRACAQFLGL